MILPQAVIIGASAGGITALQNLMSNLDDRFSLPVIVVQHLAIHAELDFSLIFGRYCKLKMLEACDKMPIEPGCVYFAPSGYHLLLEKDFSFSLSQDDPVHFSRPSIDVCFESAAEVYGARVCGVLLTGANADGAAGLQWMQKVGGLTMVQDPSEAEFRAMPQAALAIMTPTFTGTISAIAGKLRELQSLGDHDEN